jgi:hypothetical protein
MYSSISTNRSFASRFAIIATVSSAARLFASDSSSAADKPAAEKAAEATAVSPLEAGNGKFVSFADGVLTLDGSIRPSGTNKGSTGLVVWKNIDDKTKVYVVAGEDKGRDRGYKPAPALETLASVKPGTPMFVGPWFGYQDRPGIFVDVAKSRMVGTFVSYTTGGKSGGLTMLGKDLAPSGFTKKYGNSLFMRNINENTPVEESIDGGPYQSIGTVKTVLKDVKEGTVLTVHFHGEGNITLIQLGSSKEK